MTAPFPSPLARREHHDQRDLVGDHVAERPARQAAPTVRSAGLRQSKRGRAGGCRPGGWPATARRSWPRCRRWCRGRAAAAGCVSLRTCSIVGSPPASRRISTRTHDQHHVVEHRREGGRGEALAAVEQRGGHRRESVEEDLRREQPHQRHGDRCLGRRLSRILADGEDVGRSAGRPATATAVSPSRTIVMVVTAASMASSSPCSRRSTKTGTSVADRTPPSSSS